MTLRNYCGLLLILLPLTNLAQGIQWTKDLNWQQILDKAQKENKYIFVDCFTTWCGPCKIMDRDVFAQDSVGSFFNDRFLSVKVQMDKTAKDDEAVQSWYARAEALHKLFHVEAYPTLVFLSPNGKIVAKKTGGTADGQALIAYARESLTQGKIYYDPYSEYEKNVAEYKRGIIHQDKMPEMIKIAFKFQDTTLGHDMLKQHVDYVEALPPTERYTQAHIKFWSSYLLGSGTRLFRFFYTDGKIIDKVMKRKGYAQEVVDHTIQAEIISPFFQEQTKNSKVPLTGMMMMLIGTASSALQTDHSEADWKLLEKQIRQKFDRANAQRNVITARIDWYLRHFNYDKYAEYGLRKLAQYPPSTPINGDDATFINSLGWQIFLHVNDKKRINGSLKWVTKVVEHFPKIPQFLDTYGNLLYKAGRKAEGIAWEEKAAAIAPRFTKVVEQMKQGL